MMKQQAATFSFRFSMIRFPLMLIAVTGLYACALQPREGPPAPVVQLTPSQKPSRQRATPRPPISPENMAEQAGSSKTVAPAKPKTKVYVYRDPSIAPNAPATAPVTEFVAPAESAAATTEPSTANSAPTTPSETVTSAPVKAAPSRTPSVEIAKQALATPAPVVIAKAEPQQQRFVPPAATPKPAPAPASVPAPAPAPRIVHVAPPPPPPAPPISVPPLPPAAQALAAQAEQQRKSGDYTGAAASLERSLRIAPREPYLWNRLARVRMEQGQTHQAGNLAARANDLSSQNAEVKQDNWRIIAHSKRQAGDNTAADAAQQRADAN